MLVLTRARLGVMLGLAVAVRGGDARAEASDLERARALYDAAGELERKAQWSEAATKLRAALKIRETPQLRYALGWALENDDKLLEARAEYDLAERRASKGGPDDVAGLARKRLAALATKTPVVRVSVAGGASSARVIVDGREALLEDGTAIVPVNPGARVVRIERAGGAPTEKLVYVRRGEQLTLDSSETATSAPVRGTTTGDDRHDTRPTRTSAVPWVLIGGGAALGAGALALYVSSAGDASERDELSRAWCEATACVGGSTATVPETSGAAAQRQQAEDAAQRGNTKQLIGAVVGGAGLVSAAVGALILMTRSDHETDSERATSRRTHPSGLRLTGGPTRDGVMAGAALTF